MVVSLHANICYYTSTHACVVSLYILCLFPQGHTDPWERRQIAHPFAENRHPLLPLPPGYGSPAGGGGSGGSSGGIDKRRARSNKRGGHGGRLDMRSN
jgi:hypothetical protein